MDRSRRPAHRFRVTPATQDRLLAVLLVALAATGLVSLRMGASNEAWLFAFHGLLAAALAVTSVAKIGRSLPKAVAARRWRRVVLGSILSFATVASVVAGFAWVASGRLLTIGAWTVLTLHAWIGIVLIPIAVIHLAPRRWRLLGPRPPAGVAAQRRIRSDHPTAPARGRMLSSAQRPSRSSVSPRRPIA